MIALDRGLLDGTVHALHLSVRPGVVHFGEVTLAAVAVADVVNDLNPRIAGLFAIGELDAVVGQDGVDPVGDPGNQAW